MKLPFLHSQIDRKSKNLQRGVPELQGLNVNAILTMNIRHTNVICICTSAIRYVHVNSMQYNLLFTCAYPFGKYLRVFWKKRLERLEKIKLGDERENFIGSFVSVFRNHQTIFVPFFLYIKVSQYICDACAL